MENKALPDVLPLKNEYPYEDPCKRCVDANTCIDMCAPKEKYDIKREGPTPAPGYESKHVVEHLSMVERIEAAKNVLECVDMSNPKEEVLRAYNILCGGETKEPTPVPGFDEIFAAYAEWYHGKFRNHPERMSADAFFQFLKKSNLIKETV